MVTVNQRPQRLQILQAHVDIVVWEQQPAYGSRVWRLFQRASKRCKRALAATCSHLPKQLQVAASGCKWLQVAASGCKWLQVAASGCLGKWLQVAAWASGCKWLQLITAICSDS